MSTFASTSINPSFEEIKEYDTEQLVTFLRGKKLNLCENDFTILRNQYVDGPSFVKLTYERLVNFPLNISAGKATRLETVIEELNNQSKFYHKIV